MTFYTNFSSASKSISFYKRTSSPLRRRRVPSKCQTDGQYEKWCEYLHQPPKKLRVRGMASVPPGIIAGHFVSTESLTEDAEECYENGDMLQEDSNANEKLGAKPKTDINENANIYERIHKRGDASFDVNDIKQRLLEDIKSYKSRNKKASKRFDTPKRYDSKEKDVAADDKEGVERRLRDRLKVLFSKHSDWLKKTVNALKKKDAKCCKQHEKYMGISFCKA